ncbi:MAG TPA: hypothetical protein VNR59_05935, partial [Gaiellaceae bacterium]|nr:hypothetical protein [Gaiellaceae bacterium]
MAESRPAALPPAERTVGQLVAESIRFFGDHFWAVLALGLPFVGLDLLSYHEVWWKQAIAGYIVGPLICAAYVRGAMLVTGSFWSWRAYAVALLLYVPYPFLGLYVLPAVLWFALVGLGVPAAVKEGLGVRDAVRRGLQLGRADLVHAIGGLATIVIVVGVSRLTLEVLLNTQGGQAREVAVVLADFILSPLFYVGSALLYVDQAARV